MNEAESDSRPHDRVLTLVLVDATGEQRHTTAGAFREAGYAVIDVSTPLEAIVRLGESDFEPNLIAIAASTSSSASYNLRRFVDAEHPHAQLVTIADAEVARDRVACCSSSQARCVGWNGLARIATHAARREWPGLLLRSGGMNG